MLENHVLTLLGLRRSGFLGVLDLVIKLLAPEDMFLLARYDLLSARRPAPSGIDLVLDRLLASPAHLVAPLQYASKTVKLAVRRYGARASPFEDREFSRMPIIQSTVGRGRQSATKMDIERTEAVWDAVQRNGRRRAHRAEMYIHQADKLYQAGKKDAAFELYTRAVKLRPSLAMWAPEGPTERPGSSLVLELGAIDVEELTDYLMTEGRPGE